MVVARTSSSPVRRTPMSDKRAARLLCREVREGRESPVAVDEPHEGAGRTAHGIRLHCTSKIQKEDEKRPL